MDFINLMVQYSTEILMVFIGAPTLALSIPSFYSKKKINDAINNINLTELSKTTEIANVVKQIGNVQDTIVKLNNKLTQFEAVIDEVAIIKDNLIEFGKSITTLESMQETLKDTLENTGIINKIVEDYNQISANVVLLTNSTVNIQKEIGKINKTLGGV